MLQMLFILQQGDSMRWTNKFNMEPGRIS